MHLPAYLSGISLKASLSPAADSVLNCDLPSDDNSLEAPSTAVMASCKKFLILPPS